MTGVVKLKLRLSSGNRHPGKPLPVCLEYGEQTRLTAGNLVRRSARVGIGYDAGIIAIVKLVMRLGLVLLSVIVRAMRMIRDFIKI